MPKLFGGNDSAVLQEQLRKQGETIASLIAIQKSLLELVRASLLRQVDINGPANASLRQALTAAEQGINALSPAPLAPPASGSVDKKEEAFIPDFPPNVAAKPVSAPPPRPVVPPPPASQKPAAAAPQPLRPAPPQTARPVPPPAKPAVSDDDEFDLESLVGKK